MSPGGVLNQDSSCYKLARNVGCYLHFCTYLNAINWCGGDESLDVLVDKQCFFFRMHICINKCTSSFLQVTEHLFKGVICGGIPRVDGLTLEYVSAWSVRAWLPQPFQHHWNRIDWKRFACYNTRLYMPKQCFFTDRSSRLETPRVGAEPVRRSSAAVLRCKLSQSQTCWLFLLDEFKAI